MRRRFPWANANRIADDHHLEVARIEREADSNVFHHDGSKPISPFPIESGYRRADFLGASPLIYVPPDEIDPVESKFLRAVVICSIASLGVSAAIFFLLVWVARS